MAGPGTRPFRTPHPAALTAIAAAVADPFSDEIFWTDGRSAYLRAEGRNIPLVPDGLRGINRDGKFDPENQCTQPFWNRLVGFYFIYKPLGILNWFASALAFALASLTLVFNKIFPHPQKLFRSPTNRLQIHIFFCHPIPL